MNSGGLFRTPDGKDYKVTFFLITSLFMLWGFCNGLIDVMDKHFQDYLRLSKAQSAWVQFAHYLGYFLMALPAGFLARRTGYKGGIITGLIMVSLGGFWFVPATHIGTFWAFLLGVCLVSMGLTFLETVANPYTTVLGPPQFAAARINLAQSFNGIGWIMGPIVGGAFFYSSEGTEAAQRQLYVPYLAVAFIVLVLAVVFFVARVPDLETPAESPGPATNGIAEGRPLWANRHFAGAVVAQFFYVAAQAGIFSFFINYVVSEVPSVSPSEVGGWFLKGGGVQRDGAFYINEQGASRLLGVAGFGMFLLGRFVGAVLLRKVPAHRTLAAYGIVNTILCGLVVLRLGWLSVASVFLIFFFMSIMFPTIFSLGIHGLGNKAKKASAFIVMAIVGGAIMPKVMGFLGDRYNMAVSFFMPLACFVVVAAYGLAWTRLKDAVSPKYLRRDPGLHGDRQGSPQGGT
jgi:FHS family L-fucose permease-like MFS transporter